MWRWRRTLKGKTTARWRTTIRRREDDNKVEGIQQQILDNKVKETGDERWQQCAGRQ